MNSNIVKPEKFEHLHLVYHFTVPLNSNHKFPQKSNESSIIFEMNDIEKIIKAFDPTKCCGHDMQVFAC